MAINKVVYDGTTLLDLTADTVTVGDVVSGVTFHLRDGTTGTGTIVDGDILSYGVEPLVGYAKVGQSALCEEE